MSDIQFFDGAKIPSEPKEKCLTLEEVMIPIIVGLALLTILGILF